MSNQWKTGLCCNCLSAGVVPCLLGGFVPGGYCFVQGMALNEMDKSKSTVTECCKPTLTCGILGICQRKEMRERYDIQGNLVGDAVAVCCCPCFVPYQMLQTAKEIGPAPPRQTMQ